jgi:hypothetical protein
MTSAEKRQLEWAVEDIAAGRYRKGVAAICRLIRIVVPDLAPPIVPAPLDVPKGKGVLRTGPVAIRKRRETRSRSALAAYRAAWPFCQLLSCLQPGDPHHIVKRSAGGSDDASNLFAVLLFVWKLAARFEDWLVDRAYYRAYREAHGCSRARARLALAARIVAEREAETR